MRKEFLLQLKKIDDLVLKMGSRIEETFALAREALLTGDKAAAEEVVKADEELYQMERDIEILCMHLLLTQQPVARDLHLVAGTLKMITDLGRIGAQIVDLAKYAMILKKPQIKIKKLDHMIDQTGNMLNRGIKAFVEKDEIVANSVIDNDERVDKYFIKIRENLAEQVKKSPDLAPESLSWLMVIKYLERIADHACNVAEWTFFAVTGRHRQRPD
ncbi:MAG: phosphate signaling complex protein PhoU [Spirochaetaceae bacterium]|jgi:phosphate transport system protein|nr:phosphate signaling complex protein PhoU [Spirochaetaceae bacterium]